MMIMRTLPLCILLLLSSCTSGDAPDEEAQHQKQSPEGGRDEYGDHEQEGHDEHDSGG